MLRTTFSCNDIKLHRLHRLESDGRRIMNRVQVRIWKDAVKENYYPRIPWRD